MAVDRHAVAEEALASASSFEKDLGVQAPLDA
jgi:hypothetical protein